MFRNRNLLIATKHKKEEVIQPVFESYFGVSCFVPKDFDSDVLGTFSGEVERKLSPIDTAREKCRIVAKNYNADLVIASEGSFGMHPIVGFVPLEEEVLLLTDIKNGLEIKIIERSVKTNFSSREVSDASELLEFAHKAGFPSHGLILKSKVAGKDKFFKGIVNHRILLNCFQALRKRSNTVVIETDMRAMYNPTRMEVIKQGAIKLAQKIRSCCPKCSAPGFGAEKSVPGLACSQCSLPTKSIRSHVYQCAHCKYEEEKSFPNGLKTEDPMYCDFCNP